MRFLINQFVLLFVCIGPVHVFGNPVLQAPLTGSVSEANRNISTELFADLEELSRIVDISYCVGATGTGIQKPFLCASRCQDFPHFELVTTWNTGVFLSDSCGYIALSHSPSVPRIIVAFRGTYSVANTIIDLSTVPQEYIPYPGDDDEDKSLSDSLFKSPTGPRHKFRRSIDPAKSDCTNCTVHLGFMTSWRHTRPHVVPHVEELIKRHPEYQLTLVGHSLGGAVAALASLDFKSRGWSLQVTTFGEPRFGNQQLMEYVDKAFSSNGRKNKSEVFRRVTHVDDPVPLLPLSEWGYRMHAGEIYISKPELPPKIEDLRSCVGDQDPRCIAGTDDSSNSIPMRSIEQHKAIAEAKDWWNESKGFLTVPARFRIWQLFFAHRDYFWRLGLCLPVSSPRDWYEELPGFESDPW